MPVPRIPILNRAVTLTVNGVNLLLQTSNRKDEVSEEDATVNSDGGAYNFVTDIFMYSFDFQTIYDPDALPGLDIGVDYDASYAVSAGRSISGTVRLLSWNETGGAKGLMQASGSGKFRGAVTKA
jgi:hypothetical protein